MYSLKYPCVLFLKLFSSCFVCSLNHFSEFLAADKTLQKPNRLFLFYDLFIDCSSEFFYLFIICYSVENQMIAYVTQLLRRTTCVLAVTTTKVLNWWKNVHVGCVWCTYQYKPVRDELEVDLFQTGMCQYTQMFVFSQSGRENFTPVCILTFELLVSATAFDSSQCQNTLCQNVYFFRERSITEFLHL